MRDALLGLECRDYDIEVYHLNQEDLLAILSQHGRPNLVGKAFGVIHLAMRGLHLDFSFPRTENKVGQGHRGFVVQTHLDISFAQAALRRDFTVNAMGMELPHLQLIDPYGGRDDLHHRVLRHVGPAFVEDSLRVLRGVQFAARFALTPSPETVALCESLSLADLSRERIGEEFRKWLLKGATPSFGLEFFVQVGLPQMFPEITPWDGQWAARGDLLNHLVPLRDQLDSSQAMLLMLCGLLIGNDSQALSFLQAWLPENDFLKKVPALLEATHALIQWKRSSENLDLAAIRRIALRAQGIQLPMALVSAIFKVQGVGGTGQDDPALHAFALQEGVWDRAPEPYLTGRVLLELGLAPGRQLGEWIKECFELQLDGTIGDPEQAKAWAIEKKRYFQR